MTAPKTAPKGVNKNGSMVVSTSSSSRDSSKRAAAAVGQGQGHSVGSSSQDALGLSIEEDSENSNDESSVSKGRQGAGLATAVNPKRREDEAALKRARTAGGASKVRSTEVELDLKGDGTGKVVSRGPPVTQEQLQKGLLSGAFVLYLPKSSREEEEALVQSCLETGSKKRARPPAGSMKG
jgi:hypothetical protein